MKENSTRGKAQIAPKSYKGDVLSQVWLDSRVLATLSQWLDASGNPTRFLSEIIREVLSILCEKLVAEGSVELVDDTANARRILERKYKVNLNPSQRGKRNVLHNKVLSDRRKDLARDIRGDMVRNERVADVTPLKQKSVNQEELDRLVEVYKKFDSDEKNEES